MDDPMTLDITDWAAMLKALDGVKMPFPLDLLWSRLHGTEDLDAQPLAVPPPPPRRRAPPLTWRLVP